MTSALVIDAIDEGLEWIAGVIGEAAEPHRLNLFRRLVAEEPPGWVRRGLYEKPDVVDRLIEIGLGVGLDRSTVELALAEAFAPAVPPAVLEFEAPIPEAMPITASPYQWTDPASIPQRQWLYGRHLIRKHVSVDIAPGGVGKSSNSIVEALSLVTGRDLLNNNVPRPRRKVWLWNGEDPLDELQRRIQAACIYYRISPADIAGGLFVDTGRQTPIVIARDNRNRIELAVPLVEAMKKTIRENNIDAFSADPFIATHEVPENDNGKINAVARQWADIADETNCAIGLVHHVRKPNGGDLTAEDARGASALIAASRSTRALNRMTKEEGERAGIRDDHRLYFRIDNGTKVNLAPPGEAATWRKLHSVYLGNGENNGLGDSVGVVTSWTWPDAFNGVTVDNLRLVQQRICEKEFRADPRATDWVGKLVAEVLGKDLSNPANRAAVRNIITEWRRTGAICVVSKTNDQRKTKEFVEVGEWA